MESRVVIEQVIRSRDGMRPAAAVPDRPAGGGAEPRAPESPADPGDQRPPQKEESTLPFRLLRLGGFSAVCGAVATLVVMHVAYGLSLLPVAIEAAVIVTIGLIGEAMLRWAQRQLRRERERHERLWLTRQAELEQIAARDDLTQLQNRRFFYQRLQEELERAARTKKPVSIVMADVDDLKEINDEFGHQVGDIVLRQFARILNRLAREGDVTARLGGDEFAVIMPEADRREADRFAWHLWEELAATPVYENDNASIFLGISIGSGGFPWGGTDLEEIIHWADAKLYANKLERKGLKRASSKSDGRLASAVVEVLSSALDVRDRMTHRHSRRVARMASVAAKQMGLPKEQVLEIEFAAALHDIGKIGVADSILRKTDPLEAEEWREMRRHSELGFEILKGVDFLRGAAEIVYAHHERYDGAGYPRGLVGEEIPLGARVFSVIDAFDAMTSRRPYRDPMSYDMAIMEIARNAGTQFDPRVVEAFLVVIRRNPDGFWHDDDEFGSRFEMAGEPAGEGVEAAS